MAVKLWKSRMYLTRYIQHYFGFQFSIFFVKTFNLAWWFLCRLVSSTMAGTHVVHQLFLSHGFCQQLIVFGKYYKFFDIKIFVIQSYEHFGKINFDSGKNSIILKLYLPLLLKSSNSIDKKIFFLKQRSFHLFSCYATEPKSRNPFLSRKSTCFKAVLIYQDIISVPLW